MIISSDLSCSGELIFGPRAQATVGALWYHQGWDICGQASLAGMLQLVGGQKDPHGLEPQFSSVVPTVQGNIQVLGLSGNCGSLTHNSIYQLSVLSLFFYQNRQL